MALAEPDPAPELIVTLEQRAQNVYQALEVAASTIGAELLDAKREHPGKFMAWVEESLPFGIDKAERLMAVTRAFATAPPEMRDSLPNKYSTLFELSRLPAERLQRAIEAGQVTPDTTYREARALRDAADSPEWERVELPEVTPSPAAEPRLSAEIVAKELMRFPVSNLSGEMVVALRRWLM